MTKISGELDLSHIPDEQLDPAMELRVAVVREGAVLASATLMPGKAKERLPFEVVFDPPFLPGAHLPCPVRLLIGPNVMDQELLGIETLSMEIDLSPARGDQQKPHAQEKAVNIAPVKLGLLTLPVEIYQCWLFCCRTYTVRGRVVCRHWHYEPALRRWVFCDAPVPGATVEAYDVDCFLWWCRRDLIKSAVTDIHGNFTIQFRWCCINWHPWLERNWAVDPELLGQIQELLARYKIRLPPVPPGPDPDPNYLQSLAANAVNATTRGRAGGLATIGSVGNINAPVSMDALQALVPPSAELAALHVWPWWGQRDCAPDVVFRVTQRCHDRTVVIHNETNSQTRWDIPTSLNVTLLANSEACCLPVCRDPECPECIKLTWVGCTPADHIGTTAGPPDVRGYGYSDTLLDRPFYGAIQIRGGVGWDVDYFKVQVSRNGGAWSDLAVPAFEGFSRSYWDGSSFVPAPAPAFTPIAKSGRTVMITRKRYETLHPAIPRFGGSVLWNDYDTLLYFDSLANPALTPDALYQLRFVGYAADAADNLILASERILPSCGTASAETVYIRVDNQASNHPPFTADHPFGPGFVHFKTNEPDCYIRKVCKNEGRTDEHCITACEIVRLKASDTLTIHFSVTCPPTVEDGHLGGYELKAEHGVSATFDIGTGAHGTFVEDALVPGTFVVGPDYASALGQGAPRPHWYGGDYKVTLTGADFPECCAYLLRLHAWKRTTNGCSAPEWTHYNTFELAFTILRAELCPEICPDIQTKRLASDL